MKWLRVIGGMVLGVAALVFAGLSHDQFQFARLGDDLAREAVWSPGKAKTGVSLRDSIQASAESAAHAESCRSWGKIYLGAAVLCLLGSVGLFCWQGFKGKQKHQGESASDKSVPAGAAT